MAAGPTVVMAPNGCRRRISENTIFHAEIRHVVVARIEQQLAAAAFKRHIADSHTVAPMAIEERVLDEAEAGAQGREL